MTVACTACVDVGASEPPLLVEACDGASVRRRCEYVSWGALMRGMGVELTCHMASTCAPVAHFGFSLVRRIACGAIRRFRTFLFDYNNYNRTTHLTHHTSYCCVRSVGNQPLKEGGVLLGDRSQGAAAEWISCVQETPVQKCQTVVQLENIPSPPATITKNELSPRVLCPRVKQMETE